MRLGWGRGIVVGSGKAKFSLASVEARGRDPLYVAGGVLRGDEGAAAILLPYMTRATGSHCEPNFNTMKSRKRRKRSQVFGLSSWVKPYLKKMTSEFFILLIRRNVKCFVTFLNDMREFHVLKIFFLYST